MLEPLSVEPWRLVVPAANSIASARLVLPAPAGPTSAIARVPFDLPPFVPGMRLSSVRSSGAESQECAPGRSRNEQRRTLSRARQVVFVLASPPGLAARTDRRGCATVRPSLAGTP